MPTNIFPQQSPKTFYTYSPVSYYMVRFFNREHDLAILEDIYASQSSSLVVLYGRRRVGKTELSKEFLKNKKGIYLFVETKSDHLLLKDLENSLEQIIGIKPRLDNWDCLLYTSDAADEEDS